MKVKVKFNKIDKIANLWGWLINVKPGRVYELEEGMIIAQLENGNAQIVLEEN